MDPEGKWSAFSETSPSGRNLLESSGTRHFKDDDTTSVLSDKGKMHQQSACGMVKNPLNLKSQRTLLTLNLKLQTPMPKLLKSNPLCPLHLTRLVNAKEVLVVPGYGSSADSQIRLGSLFRASRFRVQGA